MPAINKVQQFENLSDYGEITKFHPLRVAILPKDPSVYKIKRKLVCKFFGFCFEALSYT